MTYKTSTNLLILQMIISLLLVSFYGLGIITAIYWLIQYATTEVTVTEKQLVYKAGLLNVKTTEIPFKKIQSVQVDKNLFGMMMSFATIKVSVGNDSSKIVFKNLGNYGDLKALIDQKMAEYDK